LTRTARYPRAWLGWSSIAFALFGIPLTRAASSGPSWLVAGSFQTTVPVGSFAYPLGNRKLLHLGHSGGTLNAVQRASGSSKAMHVRGFRSRA